MRGRDFRGIAQNLAAMAVSSRIAANAVLACLLFAASMTALVYLYFVGHWGAQDALLQEKWTASALSVGLLPFEGALVGLGSALVGGVMVWGHAGAMRLNNVFKGRRAKCARP